MNIKELSVTELKALVYDESAKLEIAQKNIQIINNEINQRAAEAKKTNEEQSNS